MSVTQIQVSVLLFARAAEIAGARQLSITIQDGSTIAQVADKLVNLHPSLDSLVGVSRWALKNATKKNEFVDAQHPITDADEIAMIPPVSGG